ncbi:DUF6476 family protein [Paracoccus sulfuroxidans]|nr:DUF6476 family protein [Paracoccus sulfuroxidans]
MDRNDKRENGSEEALPMLRWLRLLVTSLAVVMGVGIIAIVALLWLRLGERPLPELPPQIALPEGESAAAVTFARDWLVVVTDSGKVLLYDHQGKLREEVQP